MPVPVPVPSSTKSWWQYSVWVVNVARNSKITEPEGAELAFIRTFLKVIWDPVTQTGFRPWLQTAYQAYAVQAPYICDLDTLPTCQLIKILDVVGRNFKQVPISDFEALGADILFSLSDNARLGTKPHYGSVGGSVVTIV